MTRIELEHTEVLGDTVEAIAGEKAPVIRPGGLGLTGTTGGALEVVRRHARDVGAELLVLGEDFSVRGLEHGLDAARGELCLPDGSSRRFVLPGASAFSLPAFSLASRAAPRLPCGLRSAWA